MKFALFHGCNIPARVAQYADATQAVSAKLGIELVDMAEFNCCGYPARNTDFGAFCATAKFLAADRTKAPKSVLRAGYPQQLNSVISTSSIPSFADTAWVASAYCATLAGMLQP